MFILFAGDDEDEHLVKEIRRLKEPGPRVVDISRQLDKNYWTVSKIVHNKHWKEQT